MSRRDGPGSASAVGVTFAVAGVMSSAAFSRVPSLRDNVDATPAQLSLALVCVGLGSLLLMPVTGRLTERYSSAAVIRGFGIVCTGGWALAAFAPSVPLLAVCLLVTGMGTGTWDVAMNIQGHVVEQRQERVLMPKWHAVFSYGAVAGAVIGALFAKLDLSVKVQFPVLSAIALTALFWWTRDFVDDHGAAPEVLPETAELGTTALSLPPDLPARGITATEILLGLMVLATALGEGAANDWLGLTLVDTRGLPEAFGALALAGFNLTMGTARLVSGPLLARFGRSPVLRASGLIATAGVLLLCLVDSPVTAAVGAAAWGLGLAVVFPSGMSAAGEVPGRGARAISVVSTIGYTGFLLGAPLIGQLTRLVPLDRALLVVAGTSLLVVFLAPTARDRRDLSGGEGGGPAALPAPSAGGGGAAGRA
jgi:MFS family permease